METVWVPQTSIKVSGLSPRIFFRRASKPRQRAGSRRAESRLSRIQSGQGTKIFHAGIHRQPEHEIGIGQGLS